MNEVEFFTDELTKIEWVLIKESSGVTTSMLKSDYLATLKTDEPIKKVKTVKE